MPEIDSSALYNHACNLYDAMNERAGDDAIFSGQVTAIFADLRISGTYYTPLFNALKELGSIELLQRGTKGRPTLYRLHQRPDREAFDNLYLTGGKKRATLPLEGLEQRVSNIERRLDGIDIKSVLVQMEKRLRKLEGGSSGKV